MFPDPRFGGGALAVYLHGEPVVDVWTGWSDRRGHVPWTADTGAMVFSATKGMASTVIHRLVDRGLIDYDAPVAEYWPEFGANGKADITVREVMRHRAGLSHLNGVSQGRPDGPPRDGGALGGRAAPSGLRGKPAYHALTYGWLMSGLARVGHRQGHAPTDPRRGRRAAEHRRPAPGPAARRLRRPGPRRSSTRNSTFPTRCSTCWRRGAALHPLTAGFGALYFPGLKAVVQGNIPLLDSEIPAANGVATARGLARMYGALANGGQLRRHAVPVAGADRGPGGPAQPAPGPQRADADVVPPRLSRPAVPRVLPGLRPYRAGRLAGLGHSR